MRSTEESRHELRRGINLQRVIASALFLLTLGAVCAETTLGDENNNLHSSMKAIAYSPPTVSVTSPVGGESWCIGSSHDILWSASDDTAITNIALYYSTDGGSNWIPISETESNDGIYPWTIPSTPSTQCQVKVIAYDAADSAEDISDGNFTIKTMPTAPSGCIASDTLCWVHVSWTDNSTNETKFKLYRDGVHFDSVAANYTQYDDFSATPGVTYSYGVTAYNECGESAQCGDPGTVAVPPSGPYPCVASDDLPDEVNFCWTDNSGDETGFYVYRGSDKLDSVEANVTCYDDMTAAPGAEYEYCVSAYNDCGESSKCCDIGGIVTAEQPQVTSISALYDGTAHGDTIGTFVSGLTACNSFYASVIEGTLALDSVVFQVSGLSLHGIHEGGVVWRADFPDIGLLPVGANVLTVTAYDVEGNPGQRTAIVKMREIPSWYGGEWISLIEHHEEYEFVTTDGTPYYYLQISIPEPPVEWGPYDFTIEPFFPDLSNHLKVFLGIKGRFNIDGLCSDHEVGGELIAKLLGKGIDENVNVEEGDMRFEGPYNDLVGVTISGLGYEIPNQTLFGVSGWLATFWVGAVQIDLLYSAAFGLQAYIDLGAEFSIDTNYDSYVYIKPGIEPWVSLDVWASVLFGVAEIGMNFTPTFGIEFPCTLFVYPDPHAATHHCTYFVLYYSVWGSVGWGLWKGTLWGPEAGFHFDEPEGCHWGEYEFEVTPPIAAMIDSVLQYLPQVFETPSASVDPNSNRAFVVWIHDEHPEDTLLTDPEVYYGFLDSTEGAEWVPGSITENDRWETNPKVAFLSSDSVIAVWTQNEIPKADWGSVTELNTVLSNQELYYSIWTVSSGSWTEPIRITTNSLPDGCPNLHARNGKAILAWVRDSDGNLNTRADWEVFYSWYDTSGWSTPAVLSEGLGGNFEPAVALDDSTGQAIVVWTHEPDGDFNTPDDRSLYYKYIDPVTGPGPLGTDLPHEMGPFSPSVAFAPGSNPAVAYTCRSVEWDSVGAQWDTLGVGLKDKLWFSYFKDGAWDSMRVTVDDGEVIAMNPVVKVDDQNRAMIVYRGFEGEGVAGFDGEIFSVYIDLSSGAPKGENHVQYTSDTVTTWMPAFDINSEGEGKLVYVSYSPEPPDTGFDNIHIETPAWVSHYLRGDANGDQTIDVGDVVYLVNYLYRSGSAPDPLWTGDANCDLVTNVGDIVYLINYLYRGGAPPPHCG